MKDAIKILQCLTNIQAGFDYHKLPQLQVASTLVDRVFFKEEPEFFDRLNNLPFDKWDIVFDHGTTATGGWREAVAMYSMQIVRHSSGLIEVDFDICNPDYGLAPLIGHGIECLWPGKTNPFKVAKGLRKRGFNVKDRRCL